MKRKPWLLFGLGLGIAGWWMTVRRQRALNAKRWNRRMQLAGERTALITGASSGIGEAYARQLAGQGYNLVLVARREARLKALAAELTAHCTIRAEVLPADLSTEAGIAGVERFIEERQNVDFLVNNAGYDVFGPFAEIPIEKTLALINCLELACVRLCRAALPGMIRRRRGAVINVSSIGAFGPKVWDSTYVASKAYLNQFSESVALELAGSGVRVQALCPGFTLTEFHDAPEYAQYRIKERIPRWMWMTSDEVVSASLRGLAEDRRVVVPGLKYQVAAAAARLGLSQVGIGILRRFFPRQNRGTYRMDRPWVDHFGDFAEDYDRKVEFVTGGAVPAELRERLIGEGPLGRVLELGCGTGLYTAAIAPQASQVTAVDLSPELLNVAQKNLAGAANVEFRLGDCEDLGLPPASFDTIFMANFITLVDASKVLASCARLLRPDGKLIVTQFTMQGMSPVDRVRFAARSLLTFGLPLPGRKDYTVSQLASLVRSAGFTINAVDLAGEAVKAVYLQASKKPGS